MSDGLFSTVELSSAAKAGYRLKHLEILNWGTFDGQVWRLTCDSETALLTGDIGSGKSSLVDALTTLLMPSHKITYNKAAGAEARERTLRSYVEGHYKSERVESTGRSRAKGLREDRTTYSVVVGVFSNVGYDETVTLAQVFQQRDSTGQPYRFFVTATKELSVATDFADFGSDLRDLRKRLRASGVEIFDEFPKYSTSLRRLLGIRSEQALELFHQTVSMKSVGNLNDFVRDHMLEPSDASDRVRDMIAHFDDLTKAHDAVKRAREQLELLEPIVDTSQKYDAALLDRNGREAERAAARAFVCELRSRLLAEEIAQLDEEGMRLWQEQDAAKATQQALAGERDALIEERAKAGGDRIGELERLWREAEGQASRRRQSRVVFEAALTAAGLELVTSDTDFNAVTAQVSAERAASAGEKRRLDVASADAIGREKELLRTCERVGEELASLGQRTSNLPIEQVEVRARLCADLGLTPDDLPYAGELLDVSPDHVAWRGAAERVLRGFALSLLVPQQHYESVAAWANSRRLTFPSRGGVEVGAKLVYERVPRQHLRLQPHQYEGLVLADCLEHKDSPFRDYVVGQLVRRADHRCTDTLEEFRSHPRAVTREGQVRSGERHEKDDRSRVDDPRRWVLGWANEDKIAALRLELEGLLTHQKAAKVEATALLEERDALQVRLEGLARLESFPSWSDLDVEEAESRARRHTEERIRLESGTSRLEEIARSIALNAELAAAAGMRIEELAGKLATTTAAATRAAQDKRTDDDYLVGLEEHELAEVRTSYDSLSLRLGESRPTRSSECASSERVLSEGLHQAIERLGKELSRLAQALTAHMTEVLRRWPELRADMDANVEARAEFAAFRDRVALDDLPRFETEFKDQLNKNAIQELAGFNNWLGRQASAIDERVARINEALGAVPYNPGRYIRLEKELTTNRDVAQFRSDLRGLTNDSLAADGDQYSERRFLDVKRLIERFRGREGYADADKAWTARVTDVRNWFVFSASERDADTDAEWEHYSDSDGKSGGQKEKLAYTILAASLAYQFGLAWGVEKSRDFRFAVIDEAFGRGSDVSTRYALELFAKLGLQLLIVTPLQKVHVIEPYVKAIGFVDNPTGTCSRVQTMTIEDYRARRDDKRS
jgi:uncharacterized protein YPO0396